LITDVFRSCPLLCTIHHLINFTLASVEKVPAVPAGLDKGHQSKPYVKPNGHIKANPTTSDMTVRREVRIACHKLQVRPSDTVADTSPFEAAYQ
jgi:hypothetical protein